MLNTVYRLVSPKQIEAVTVDEEVTPGTVIVRPTYLSICHADQRYYQGTREPAALRSKLPMALIHEGVGEVVRDCSGLFAAGDRVVIVPNTPVETDPVVAENYLPSSKFRSSGFDGLMQEYVFSAADRLIRVPETIPSVIAAFIEMVSVSMHCISRLERIMDADKEVFGIWGDGNLGYITANLLKELCPASQIFVFGKSREKLNFFSFADRVFTIDSIPSTVSVSQAFECVGDDNSHYAIDQIIHTIRPQGSVALMGVSEHPIEIDTRTVLEKGLSIVGASRSGVEDFVRTVDFLSSHPGVRTRFENLVGIQRDVRSISDIDAFFDDDLTSSWGKSVMKWDV
jgi:ribitol-5-phosphate 2-dehydrogenase